MPFQCLAFDDWVVEISILSLFLLASVNLVQENDSFAHAKKAHTVVMLLKTVLFTGCSDSNYFKVGIKWLFSEPCSIFTAMSFFLTPALPRQENLVKKERKVG